MKRGVVPLLRMYKAILAAFDEGLSNEEVLKRLSGDPELDFLLESTNGRKSRRKTFTREVKNAAFLREALDKAMRCRICGARMHFKSFTMDHIIRVANGGLGSVENAQPTHPYCNSGYKEAAHHEAVKQASDGGEP